MLAGWSQAFPYHNVATEDAVMKEAVKLERERRDVILNVSASYIFTAYSLHTV